MSDPSLKERIIAYLMARNVLALATNGPQGPWAAPVFFASDGLRLYFVSDPSTRHGSNIGDGTRVAGAVTEDHKDWTTIQGIQLEGFCRPVGSEEKEAAVTLYLGKYPFAAILLDPSGPLYEKAGQKVVFYCLEPDGLWMTDNTRGFGSREHLAPQETGC